MVVSTDQLIFANPSRNASTSTNSSSISNAIASQDHHPSSSSTASLAPNHEIGSVLRSIQKRSHDRYDDEEETTLKLSKGETIGALEADLRLAAQVGQALLEEKAGLEKKLNQAENGSQKLLDRLTMSVREAQQLQKRLEETVNNLEQADANNRALLVTLEEDRKTITRLSSDSGKLVATAASLKSLTRTHEDTLQELSSERKRASHAESRVKKAGDRVAEMEERLRRAIEDLEEMRQDKVLRSRKSHDALAKVKAKYGSAGSADLGSDDNPEAAELLKLVESLVSENQMLRSESQELQGLLDTTRDEQPVRTGFAEEDTPNEEDEFEEHGPRSAIPTALSSNLMSEVLSSPSLSQSASRSYSDFDNTRPLSPTSTEATSFHQSTLSASTRTADLSRTFGSSSGSFNVGADEPTRHAHFTPSQTTGRDTRRRYSSGFTSVSSSGGLPTPKIPIGRRHSATRKTLSVDLRGVDARFANGDSAPTSPNAETDTENRPSSAMSSTGADDAGFVRPRRHHRPLSLSLGPPLFPQVPEDEPSSFQFRSTVRHSPHPHNYRASSSSSGPESVVSAASASVPISPTKRKRISLSPAGRTSLVDSCTQTSPPTVPRVPSIQQPSTSTPRRGSFSNSSRSASPRFASDLPRSTTTASVSSDGDHGKDIGLVPGQSDMRTAALSNLIDHTMKLLARIQAADIVTQEKRLKKQHLSGDVRHLAQANMKILLNDIEELRSHFRRVLEQERSSSARDGSLSPNLHDGLPSSAIESLVLRKDFVALVKLFRDLLFEVSRLRALVNRVEIEPHLAASLRELDIPGTIDLDSKRAADISAAGFLAPLSRFIPAALMPSESQPSASMSRAPSQGLKSSTSPSLAPRPAPKRSGVSAISSATVNVEFGKGGAMRRAIESERSPDETGGPVDAAPSPSSMAQGHAKASLSRRTGLQVKRDLNSIFAGASTASTSTPRASEPWTILPRGGPSTSTAGNSVAGSYNPFNRLMASYRPAMSSTTNAVLDSIPHAAVSSGTAIQPTLLERQLRPRGLSDSSIRSTFVAHANPHHRIISPATLALSSESSSQVATPVPIPIMAQDSETGADMTRPTLKQQLTESLLATTPVSRKPSLANLRSQRSSNQLRSVSAPHSAIPPVPALPKSTTPIAISISPSSATGVESRSIAGAPVSSSIFGTLTTWATGKDGSHTPASIGSWAGNSSAERERRELHS